MGGKISGRFVSAFLAASMVIAFPGVAEAGFTFSTMEDRSSGGHDYVAISGITHDLNPLSYYQFRIRIKHADAQFPAVGWPSDGFNPITGPIDICNVSGCEASEIEAGVEGLDWTNRSKVSVFLEYKTGQLAPWHSTQLSN